MDYRRFGMPDFNAVPRSALLFAVLSGGMLALSFPKPELWPLAWIAFLPLLIAIGRKSPRQAGVLGFLTGMVANAGILYWLNIVMVSYGHLPVAVSVCLYLLLTAYLSLYPAAVAWGMRRGELLGISPLLTFPVLWTGLEYLRSFALTGFPWASLGYSQYRLLPLIQVADLTGVYGVSFLIAFANVLLYRLLRSFIGTHPCPRPVAGLLVLVLLLGGTLWYGASRLKVVPSGAPVKVALIQGDIPQDVKWDPAFQEATVSIYERLTRRAMQEKPDLVVWPESAAPFYFQDEYAYAQRVINLVKGTGSYLLFGSPAYEQVGDRVHYLNSAFLVGPDGSVLGRSDKMHLVPFGEYVPLSGMLPFVHKLVAGIVDFSPAQRLTPLETNRGKLGVLICYEGIFPELSRRYVLAGSQILVNISNDAWYKRSSAPYQDFSMTVFRAVENRVPLVRATNTGISAIIDSRGRMHGTTPLFEEAVLEGSIVPGSEQTFYTRHGDLFAGLCLALTAILALAGFVKRIDQDR